MKKSLHIVLRCITFVLQIKLQNMPKFVFSFRIKDELKLKLYARVTLEKQVGREYVNYSSKINQYIDEGLKREKPLVKTINPDK